MAIPDLIYCAAGNRRFAEIAKNAGYLLGAQLPGTVYFPIYFADQNWKSPDKERYLQAIETHRPYMASVIDWEHPEQINEVFAWAEDIATFVSVIMIIPKVTNETHKIPETIGSKPVRLGYSVPTRHGGTQVPLWEFKRRPVHLLGGSPGQQMRISRYLNVKSVDGNMMQKMAVKHCGVWEPGAKPFKNKWPSIKELDGEKWGDNAPYEAFRRSCNNIMEAWEKCYTF